ncbi:hypothetical protein NLJ89_g2433 [Agrocybe chaxingu]|uniref:Uncharacterized protein n=1 Tax=Agrocybe chaxingu TaxID=84603 RepID=A0A9W8MYW0_9AGAR|nr:hypothetical protein NLJ89_g2433 [Agrocybe chaxingu]
MFRAAALAAFVAVVSAQSLSTECTNALAGVAADPAASACLSVGLCGSPACSNETLASVVQNVTAGCSTELSGIGFTSDSTPQVTSIVQQYYPTVRKVVCLKDGDTNCITQTLTNIEGTVGTLSLNNILQIVANPPDNLPTNISCTNCVKEAYNVIRTDVPSIVSDADPALQSQCGASFTDGTTPSGITQSASTADGATTSTGAALGSVSMLSNGVIAGLGASGLVVISTLFTVFA